MKKIKGQGTITKIITSRIGRANKKRFADYIKGRLQSIIDEMPKTTIQLDMVSFSSSYDYYDQILSILSFVRYVGTPVSWTIYSDGSHTLKQIEFLALNFTFVKVETVDWSQSDTLFQRGAEQLLAYKDDLLSYAEQYPLGKRLVLYLTHLIKRPTIFLDADILFYEKAAILHELLQEKAIGWFLPDSEWGCLDSRYKMSSSKQLYQVNGGFILVNNNFISLTAGLEFLKSLDKHFEYFSEQTIMHIILKDSGFMPLDPRIFVLNSGDQFDFTYLCDKNTVAIRHYTGPVRHKMWQRDWRWQLSLS